MTQTNRHFSLFLVIAICNVRPSQYCENTAKTMLFIIVYCKEETVCSVVSYLGYKFRGAEPQLAEASPAGNVSHARIIYLEWANTSEIL